VPPSLLCLLCFEPGPLGDLRGGTPRAAFPTFSLGVHFRLSGSPAATGTPYASLLGGGVRPTLEDRLLRPGPRLTREGRGSLTCLRRLVRRPSRGLMGSLRGGGDGILHTVAQCKLAHNFARQGKG